MPAGSCPCPCGSWRRVWWRFCDFRSRSSDRRLRDFGGSRAVQRSGLAPAVQSGSGIHGHGGWHLADLGHCSGVYEFSGGRRSTAKIAGLYQPVHRGPSQLFDLAQYSAAALGAMLDIFSALVIMVPLLLPVAVGYGIHPVHLGIIFLANMQIGYFTPPVGMNLFIASYRFKKPLTELYTATLPFFMVLLFALMLITYFPYLSLWHME